jgi:protein-S-isoprenylcysteine O-methyltransferase Ste14
MAAAGSNSRATLRPRLDWAALSDAAARGGAVLWFATIVVFALAPRLAAAVRGLGAGDALSVVRLIAAFCLFCFYVLIIVLTLLRARPIAKSPGLRPRLEAALGGFLVYVLPLLPPSKLGVAGQTASVLLMATGISLAVIAIACLGRSFSIMAEARGLVTHGPYAVVRHPLYLAEGIANLGLCLQFAWLPAAALLVVQSLFQVRRMLNEEAVLGHIFPDYAAYRRRTARLIPGVW